jgi:DNA polymerase-3 subunit delta
MPIYLFWGENEFALNRAAVALRDRVVDPDWASFNSSKILPDQPNGAIDALNQVMTPPFGAGSRFVWLVETTLCQRCSEEMLTELERTLPVVPETSVLLLTTASRPDGRIKSTKLLQKFAEIREFASVPLWKTEQLVQQVRQTAQEVGVKLTVRATEHLAEAVGGDTRRLLNELEKLRLYAASEQQLLGEDAVMALVVASTHNSLQLAHAIRQGDTARSLSLVADLFRQNEPALRIVATLVSQFRTWLWVKLMVESGEQDDRAIAAAADVGNYKRVYFLKQEVKALRLDRLLQTPPILLELEVGLKQGGEELAMLQTKVIELCQLYSMPSMRSSTS